MVFKAYKNANFQQLKIYISISFLKTVYNWLTAVFIIPELNVTKRKCNKKKLCAQYILARGENWN